MHAEIPAEILLMDDRAAVDALARARWPDGFRCAGCGSTRHHRLQERVRVFECADCGKQRSVTAGTPLDRTRLPLRVWFAAAWLLCTPPGVSAEAFARTMRLRTDTAFRVLHRVRTVMWLCAFDVPGKVPAASIEIHVRPPWRQRATRRNTHTYAGIAQWGERPEKLAMAPVARPDMKLAVVHSALAPPPPPMLHATLRITAGALRRRHRHVSARWLPRYLAEAVVRWTRTPPAFVIECMAALPTFRWRQLVPAVTDSAASSGTSR